jgi:UDP-N-acetylmuramate dehydrogenase
MHIEEHVSLAPFTTFGIGGPARFFVRVQNVEELQEAIAFANTKTLPTLLLGGGSNMLVPDRGFDGLVIKIEIAGAELVEEGSNTLLIAGAGESWDMVVAKSVSKELWGLENLSGIPGTVGGAVVQNIGAYGAALSQTLLWVEVYNSKEGVTQKLSNAECAFGYRDSFFKHHPNCVVLRAAFTLSAEPSANVSYKDLASRFSDSSQDLGAIREAVLEIRKGKFPDLSVEGTAGSFFKNPILPTAEAQALKQKYPQMPLFDMPETSGVKVPLAWLLDKVLNLKGATVGGARLYEKQPLVIAAQKNTSANDVAMLAEKVQKEVKEKLQIEIEAEVKVIS